MQFNKALLHKLNKLIISLILVQRTELINEENTR